jgi:hypothetical protein
MEEISSKLGVDLPQDIASNREVHAFAKVLVSDALRHQVKAVADSLVGFVETLVAQHDDHNSRSLFAVDQPLELLLARIGIITSFDLDPKGFLDIDADLSGSLLKN